MHIDILIPTYDRLEPLKKCIKSIVDSDYKNLSTVIIVDGNKKMLDGLKDEPIEILFNPERMDYVFSINKAMKHTAGDAVLYASDDLLFWPDCISNAVKAMKEHFPDTDGLVVLKQVHKESGSAFGLLGRKFINRFPDSAVFCPEFIHYAGDTELKRFARSIERFYQCREAIVDHSRPHDNTRTLAREVKRHDKRTHSRRKERRFIWGYNFERIRNNKDGND